MSEEATDRGDRIRRTVAEFLRGFVPEGRLAKLGDTTPLVTGGILNSITLVELVGRLEQSYGITFDAHEMSIEHFDTLADIVRIVETKVAERA